MPLRTDVPTVALSGSRRSSASNDARRSPPPFARDALADGPGQKDQDRKRDVAEQQLEADLSERRPAGVDVAEADPFRGRPVDHDVGGDDEHDGNDEERRRCLHAHLSGVVLAQEGDQEHEQDGEQRGEADERDADLAAVAGVIVSIGVLLAEVPAGEAVAGEIDVEQRHDLAGRER